MSLKKVTAIFDGLQLEVVQKALVSHGIKGFTIQAVRGRGAYFNSYTRDPLTTHILLTTYTRTENAHAVAQVIIDAAHVNTDNEGLVSISPIDEVYWINTKQCCDENQFEFYEMKSD